MESISLSLKGNHQITFIEHEPCYIAGVGFLRKGDLWSLLELYVHRKQGKVHDESVDFSPELVGALPTD